MEGGHDDGGPAHGHTHTHGRRVTAAPPTGRLSRRDYLTGHITVPGCRVCCLLRQIQCCTLRYDTNTARTHTDRVSRTRHERLPDSDVSGDNSASVPSLRVHAQRGGGQRQRTPRAGHVNIRATNRDVTNA